MGAFGGLLLLGGRLSHLLGARRDFAAGWAILLAGSALAGAAGGVNLELAGRGPGRGVRADRAVGADPAHGALRQRPEGRRRSCCTEPAAPAGGTAGVFLGGVLTEYASWPWVFYVNIPVALLVLAAVQRLLPAVPRTRTTLDWPVPFW